MPRSRSGGAAIDLELSWRPAADPPDAESRSWREPWTDLVGHIRAHEYEDADGVWLDVPAVGRFRLPRAGERTEVHPFPGVSVDAVLQSFARIVSPVVAHRRGLEVLHASAIHTADGVVAFAAPSGTGKSSLAHMLERRGHAIWADDVVAFDGQGSPPSTLKLPYASSVDSELIARTNGRRQIAARGPKPTPGDAAPLTAVYLIRRDHALAAGAISHPRRLSPPHAFQRAFEHAFFHDAPTLERKRETFSHFLCLATSVPVLEFRFGPGLDGVDRLADEVEPLIAIPG
jgi:hypothetical protein